jgi:UDP-N-acetylmuramoylalanine--D-glutamate ligase
MGREVEMKLADLARAKVLIIGGGVTGTSVAEVLESIGSEISILDEGLLADERFVGLNDAFAHTWDLAILSPGWRPNHPVLELLREKGIPFLSEIDLAWHLKNELRPSQKWLAITGTNGKTTTVEMTTAMLRAGGRSATACGNVGDTVIGAVVGEVDFEFLVLELSSFQLHWSDLPEFEASAILNIADDHTDWHGSFQDYIDAKLRILERARIGILNADDATVVESTLLWHGEKIFYSLNTPKPGELGVVEDLLVDRAFVADTDEAGLIAELVDIQPSSAHNVSNTLAAAGIARSVGVAHPAIRSAIQAFRPGRHRIELVGERNGVRWINDSKATNPHAAAASLNSSTSTIWIAGGLAKGASMHDLVSQNARHIRAAILIGKDRELIADELTRHAGHVEIIRIDHVAGEDTSLMEKVVIQATKLARSGDTVLMAPSCASMDQFISYADRGDQFCEAVKKFVLS